jgi:hypothetical protein
VPTNEELNRRSVSTEVSFVEKKTAGGHKRCAHGLRRGRRMRMKVKALTSLCVLVLVGCSTTSRGPSDDEVKKDVASQVQLCQAGFGPNSKIVKDDEIKSMGRNIEGNTATIVVETTYHWELGRARGQGVPGSAEFCESFDRSKSEGKLTKKFAYRKYDTGWRFEEISWP